MSIETTRQLMYAYADDLVARRDYEQHMSESVTVSLMGYGREVSGRAAARQFIDYFHDQAFKAEIQILSLVCGEDKACAEALFHARHIGDFEGVPASGRQVNVPYSVGYDIAGGKITALRIYMPMDVLMRQLQ